MARGDKDDNSIQGQTEEFKAWLARMEAMDAEELREYGRQNKDVLTSQMKAAIKKLIMQKKQPKKRKKRTAVHPILGAVLKFHKDDDDTPPPGPGGANAC